MKLVMHSETKEPVLGKYDNRFGLMIPYTVSSEYAAYTIIPVEELSKMFDDILKYRKEEKDDNK